MPTNRIELKKYPGKVFTQPSMANESLKNQVDINNIYKRYCNQGVEPTLVNMAFIDNSMPIDSLLSAKEIMDKASNSFIELPSFVREEFGNDVYKFYGAMTGPDSEKYYTKFSKYLIYPQKTEGGAAAGPSGGANPSEPSTVGEKGPTAE